MSNHNITWIDLYEDEGWDESQLVDITILQRTMGTISLVGSSYVIQDVFRNERKRNHTFHRLMVGLSTSDILSSFFVHMLSTTPIPKGYHVFAVGNVATCDAQGFIMFLCFFTTTLYNCSLATYYLVQLKFNWAERRIKTLEKSLHIVPWSVGLIFAIAGLVLKLYGPLGFSCAISPGYPFECIDPDLSIDCIRGCSPSVFSFLYAALSGILFLAMCYISVTMFMVYRSVSNIEIQGRRYSFGAYRSQVNYRKRSHRVMLQGILYSLALFLSYLFSIVEIFNNNESYVTHILEYTFWPLQGFFNASIYSIPVFQRMHKKWKEKRRERQTALLESQEAATEEIQKSRETGIIHSGLIRDHQFKLKNDHIESNIVQKIKDSDACDGEEMEEETQDGDNYLIPFPYHSGNGRLSYESSKSEGNLENGVYNDDAVAREF